MNKITSILDLINRFRIFLLKLNFLIVKKTVLISFSGGQDSSCLIILLMLLEKQLHLFFEMIYCNHLWNLNSLYTFSHIFKISFNLSKNAIFVVNKKKTLLKNQPVFGAISSFTVLPNFTIIKWY